MAVALVDYGVGNLRSVARALEVAGAGPVVATSRADQIAAADRVVLPGVGAFGHCIAALSAVPGLRAALDEAALRRAVPVLGICVGMQLMADAGHEYGVHPGLGWIAGSVRRMAPEGLKIPQIGWNRIEPASPWAGLMAPGHGYFVHSYAFHADDPADVAAWTDYGGPITAAIARDNLLGVQFHPEKSQRYGLDLLARWLAWAP
jgi:glutamine amidotransferase